jgi:hypothetical protein
MSISNQVKKISIDFICLDQILNMMRRKKDHGIWDLVKISVENMSQSTFNLDDLSIILSIFPEAYCTSWKSVAKDTISLPELFLCISINENWLQQFNSNFSTSNKEVDITKIDMIRPLQVESRKDTFKLLIEKKMNSLNNENNNVVLIEPNHNAIPVKPEMSSRKRCNEEAHQLSKKIAIDRELNVTNTKERIKNIKENEIKEGRDGDSFEVLKILVMEREKHNIDISNQILLEKKEQAKKNRFKSLPVLCDAIRSLCISGKKSGRPDRFVWELNTFVMKIAPDLGLNINELKIRIKLLQEMVPEFISIIPPDDLVKIWTLRINSDAPFVPLRQKVSKIVLNY